MDTFVGIAFLIVFAGILPLSAIALPRKTGTPDPEAPEIGGYPMPEMRGQWQRYYACLPVMPSDEAGVFWLETVWRRRGQDDRWQYRSFRTEDEKNAELLAQRFL